MPSIFFYAAITAASATMLAILVRIIDGRVKESIERHVTAALGEAPPRCAASVADVSFDEHVAQALTVVLPPSQRRAADHLRGAAQ